MPALAPEELSTITNREFRDLLRRWGWKASGDTYKRTKFTKGGFTVGFLRSASKALTPHATVAQAANVDGVSVDEWVKGPSGDCIKPPADQWEDDLEFWLDTPFPDLEHDPDGKARYLRVRDALDAEGTLASWNKVKEQRRKDIDKADKVAAALAEARDAVVAGVPGGPEIAVETFEAPVLAGSLTAALEKCGRQKNKLNDTACQVLATLALGPVEDRSGGATRVLWEMLPRPTKNPTGITMLCKELEDFGLLERKVNGKRTSLIKLVTPIELTAEEKIRYTDVRAAELSEAWDEVLAEPPAPQPTKWERGEWVKEELHPVDDSLPSAVSDGPVAEVGGGAGESMGTALSLLRAELESLEQRAAGIRAAIEVLERHGLTSSNDCGRMDVGHNSGRAAT